MLPANPAPPLHHLWRSALPLMLASASRTRRDLLRNAGLPVETRGSDVDERALEAAMPGADAGIVAAALAAAKAVNVSITYPAHLVLGADQTLALDGAAFHKPADRAAARLQLLALQGRTHQLISAFALARAGEVVASGSGVARITLRPLSEPMIDGYLAAAGDVVRDSVGGYQLEGLGAHLIEAVEGDYFTVLGLPMLDVLATLRRLGVIEA